MDRNMEILEKLKNLDDDGLRAIINEVAGAMGMNEGMRRAALSHTGMLRRRLNKASREDLEKAIGMVGKEKAEEIIGKLKR